MQRWSISVMTSMSRLNIPQQHIGILPEGDDNPIICLDWSSVLNSLVQCVHGVVSWPTKLRVSMHLLRNKHLFRWAGNKYNNLSWIPDSKQSSVSYRFILNRSNWQVNDNKFWIPSKFFSPNCCSHLKNIKSFLLVIWWYVSVDKGDVRIFSGVSYNVVSDPVIRPL